MNRLSLVLAFGLFALAPGTHAADAAPITDADIANFALNLEYLEGNFYSCAIYGKSLNKLGLAGKGAPEPIGCMKANLSPEAYAIGRAIADDEIEHVRFLRDFLGAAAVSAPLINIGSAFSDAANAAFNATLMPSFNPYANDILFYHGAFIFEDVGVTAYKGAAPLIMDKGVLQAAAGILAVEAYHAGAIRTKLFEIKDQFVFPYATSVNNIVGAIASLRGVLSASQPPKSRADEGLTSGSSQMFKFNLAPADYNGIAFSRTPAQVIAIVTAGAANNKGLFFPNGLNGVIA